MSVIPDDYWFKYTFGRINKLSYVYKENVSVMKLSDLITLYQLGSSIRYDYVRFLFIDKNDGTVPMLAFLYHHYCDITDDINIYKKQYPNMTPVITENIPAEYITNDNIEKIIKLLNFFLEYVNVVTGISIQVIQILQLIKIDGVTNVLYTMPGANLIFG